MRLNLYLILALFCLSATVSAQEKFKKGQIVTLQGDTIHGFIDYKNWRKNPDKISFKVKENDPVNTYVPEDLQSFTVFANQTEIYRAKKVSVSICE